MKKLLLAFTALAGMAMGACSTDVKDSTNLVHYPTCNLVSSPVTGEAFAEPGIYSFFFNFSQGRVSILTDNLELNSKSNSFVTDTVPYLSYVVRTEGGAGSIHVIKNAEGVLNRDKSVPVKVSSFMITSCFNYNATSVPGLTVQQNPYPRVLGQYTIGGEWEVRTFSDDAFYSGTTDTSYKDRDGADKTYSTTSMTYRAVIDLQKEKATIVIYNAKFSDSDREPVKKLIILNDLDVEWGHGRYTIKGENIVPSTVENNQAVPNPNFVFDTFCLETVSNDLNKVKIDYKVAGVYSGSFEGIYVMEDPSVEKN